MINRTLIIWTHTELAKQEIEAVFGDGAMTFSSQRVTIAFAGDIAQAKALSERLGCAAKRGVETTLAELKTSLAEVSLFGSNSEDLARRAKKTCGCRRYKIVEALSADLEVKQKGAEVLVFGDTYVMIHGRQNIDRFTALDIEKPMRGMQIGMMPAKLAQMLVNIGVGCLSITTPDVTVYDPFCGFGTTLFVANALGYHTIWSDLLITSAKANLNRWKAHAQATTAKMTIFKHDATQPVTKPFVRATSVIVTEGRLWPVMSQTVYAKTKRDAKRFAEIQHTIITLYTGRLAATKQTLGIVPIVCTVPVYPDDTHMLDEIVAYATQQWRSPTILPVYRREKQIVGRGVLVLRA